MFKKDDLYLPTRFSNNFPIIPSSMFPTFPIVKSPLAVAAENEPLAVIRLGHKALATTRVEERNLTLRSYSNDHASMVCQWLASRPHEREIDIETGGFVGRRGFFTNETEKVYLRTRVRTR